MNIRRRYLATTLMLLGAGLAVVVTQGGGRPAGPPRLARPATPPPAPPPAPLTAEALLARDAALGLEPAQRERLEALHGEWTRDSRALEVALREATEEFARFMTGAQAGRGAPLGELEQRSAEVRQLSATLRERRRAHAAAAEDLLNDSQRRRAQSMNPASGGADR